MKLTLELMAKHCASEIADLKTAKRAQAREALETFRALVAAYPDELIPEHLRKAEAPAIETALIDPEKQRTCKIVSKVSPDAAGDLRLVTGIVLEPDIADAQKDTYSADEIRKTAHLWMLDFQNIGLQHKAIVNHQVRVVESWIAPGDVDVNGTVVKAGTWMMTVKVFDDDIWTSVKKGELTGFSIAGWAKRVPLNGEE